MNEINVLGLLFVILLRSIGFVSSYEFYLKLKDIKFIKLVFGWLFWIISGAINLTSQMLDQTSLHVGFILLNTIFSALGDIFILIGIISYFRNVPNSFFIISALFFVIGPIVAVVFNLNVIINVISVIRFVFILLFTLIPFIDRKRFKRQVSSKTFIWFSATIIFLYFYTFNYFSLVLEGKIVGGIVESSEIEEIIYFFLMDALSIMLVILVNHVEYDISNFQKTELKDKYSHDLGNIIQIIYTSIELTREKNSLELLDMVEENLKKSESLIREIRSL